MSFPWINVIAMLVCLTSGLFCYSSTQRLTHWTVLANVVCFFLNMPFLLIYLLGGK